MIWERHLMELKQSRCYFLDVITVGRRSTLIYRERGRDCGGGAAARHS